MHFLYERRTFFSRSTCSAAGAAGPRKFWHVQDPASDDGLAPSWQTSKELLAACRTEQKHEIHAYFQNHIIN